MPRGMRRYILGSRGLSVGKHYVSLCWKRAVQPGTKFLPWVFLAMLVQTLRRQSTLAQAMFEATRNSDPARLSYGRFRWEKYVALGASTLFVRMPCIPKPWSKNNMTTLAPELPRLQNPGPIPPQVGWEGCWNRWPFGKIDGPGKWKQPHLNQCHRFLIKLN